VKITEELISNGINQNSTIILNEISKSNQHLIGTSNPLLKEIAQQIPVISTPDLKLNAQKLQNVVQLQQSTNILQDKSVFNLNSVHNAHDLKCLMNDQDLSRVLNKNPWQVNIKKTLDDLQHRLYENAYIKFRIGGKAIYSASQIVRAKSFLMLEESQQTEDAFKITESDAEDLGSQEENILLPDNSIQISEAEVIANLKSIGSAEESTTMANLAGITYDAPTDVAMNFGAAFAELATENPDLTVESVVPTIRNYEVDDHGNRFLKEPDREVFRKITFQDLGKALFKTLSYQFHESKKSKRTEISMDECIPQILPENILKKAEEERALVEFQISKMFDNILQIYHNESNPVPFLNVVLNKTADGVVRTLLYLLHLANRKKIELWQKIPESERIENSKKVSKKKSPETTFETEENKSHSKDNSNENAGSDIFITPL